MDASAIFAGIDTTQKVIDSWINHGLNFANYGLSKRQMNLQEKAFEWQKYYDQNQTQIRVDDFAKAGLNPILASGSSGGSSVSGVSASPAQPTASPSDYTGNLVQTLMQKKELEQSKQLADARNSLEKTLTEKRVEADKEIASERAETDKYVADLNATTARINAEVNARSQESIATANNEAQAAVREAEAYLKTVEADKIDWQNLYNMVYSYYDGSPTSVFQAASDIRDKIASLFPNYVVEQYKSRVLDKLKDKIFSDKKGGKK